MKLQPFRVVKSKLEKAGFVKASQSGSHIKFARTMSDGTRTTTVPFYLFGSGPPTLCFEPGPFGSVHLFYLY